MAMQQRNTSITYTDTSADCQIYTPFVSSLLQIVAVNKTEKTFCLMTTSKIKKTDHFNSSNFGTL